MEHILKLIVIILFFGSAITSTISLYVLIWFEKYKDISLNLILSCCLTLVICGLLKSAIDKFYKIK
jgi:hypothetical protein